MAGKAEAAPDAGTTERPLVWLEPTRRQPALLTPGLIIGAFIALQIAAQLALLMPELTGTRLFARGGVFAGSLALLLLVRGRGAKHPAQPLAVAMLVFVAVSLFHPYTSSTAAGLAQFGMYVAIVGPLFWVSRLAPGLDAMRGCLMMLWLFHSLSAIVGILQVLFPGMLQPPISPVILEQGRGYVESLKITTVTGARIFRPMGLTDVPGGAASAGFTALFLGVGFYLTARGRVQVAAAGLSMIIGLMCLYLSQVRALLVMALVCGMALGGILLLRRNLPRALSAGAVLLLAIMLGLQLSVSLGGTSVTGRLATLTEGSPGEVYQANRGQFLEHTVRELLPRYPLGAGLGRWGMMNMYFGAGDASDSAMWAEIQWTGWLLDGGVPLILLYVLTMFSVLHTAWRISRFSAPPDGRELSLWAMLFLAHGIGILALTFSYPVFISQTGLEFWLLNALLYSAAYRSTLRRRPG
jgi:hypothetical protein